VIWYVMIWQDVIMRYDDMIWYVMMWYDDMILYDTIYLTAIG
jgi:hypothetical protein